VKEDLDVKEGLGVVEDAVEDVVIEVVIEVVIVLVEIVNLEDVRAMMKKLNGPLSLN